MPTGHRAPRGASVVEVPASAWCHPPRRLAGQHAEQHADNDNARLPTVRRWSQLSLAMQKIGVCDSTGNETEAGPLCTTNNST